MTRKPDEERLDDLVDKRVKLSDEIKLLKGKIRQKKIDDKNKHLRRMAALIDKAGIGEAELKAMIAKK